MDRNGLSIVCVVCAIATVICGHAGAMVDDPKAPSHLTRGWMERPTVMMRFSSAQTRSVAEWKETATAFANNRGCCDEVWFSTGESFPSVAWHRQHADCIREAAADMRKLGIGVSMQFEMTIGHGDDFPTEEEKKVFDKSWTGWTGPDGTECHYCNCPRQPGFLRRLEEISELYAVIHPSVVWIDDDLRIDRHNPVSGKDGPGCWCAKCVSGFSAEEGRPWTRETLHAEWEKNNLIRERWEDFSVRSVAEVALTIARAFRKVSPETRMGLQTGGDRKRLSNIVLRRLEKELGDKVCLRLGGDAYYDVSPYEQIAKSRELAADRQRFELEDVVDNWCTEIESYPRAYGSRSARSIALEAFSALGWGFDTVSVFVMDRRSETDAFYSKYLLRPLISVTRFLNDYCRENVGTLPAGFICPMDAHDIRVLIGLPLLPGIGWNWGEISAEREALPGLGAVWGDFRSNLIPDFRGTPSAKLQVVRDRLSGSAPLKVVSPFVGLVFPRVKDDGALKTIGLIGARLDDQQDIVIEIETGSENVVWRELDAVPVSLEVKVVDGRRRITIPRIGAWNAGYLKLF